MMFANKILANHTQWELHCLFNSLHNIINSQYIVNLSSNNHHNISIYVGIFTNRYLDFTYSLLGSFWYLNNYILLMRRVGVSESERETFDIIFINKLIINLYKYIHTQSEVCSISSSCEL